MIYKKVFIRSNEGEIKIVCITFKPIILLQCNIRLLISDSCLYQIAISITSSSPEERNNVKENKNTGNNKTRSTNTASSSLITSFVHNGMISSSSVPTPLSTSLPDSETTVLRYLDNKFSVRLICGIFQILNTDKYISKVLAKIKLNYIIQIVYPRSSHNSQPRIVANQRRRLTIICRTGIRDTFAYNRDNECYYVENLSCSKKKHKKPHKERQIKCG